jgi:hypothetical protein
MLEKVANQIASLPDVRTRELFAKALHDSIALDTTRSWPQPMGARDIYLHYGITPETQRDFRIVISKKGAAEFVAELRFPHPEQEVAKKLTSRMYTAMFQRRPEIIGRELIFTYAEVLHLLRLEFPVPLPAGLSALLAES